MERLPRNPFRDSEPRPDPLRQLRNDLSKTNARTSRWTLRRLASRHGHRECDEPSFIRLRSNLFPNVLKRIEGDRTIPWLPKIGLAGFRARSDRLAASLGDIQRP